MIEDDCGRSTVIIISSHVGGIPLSLGSLKELSRLFLNDYCLETTVPLKLNAPDRRPGFLVKDGEEPFVLYIWPTIGTILRWCSVTAACIIVVIPNGKHFDSIHVE